MWINRKISENIEATSLQRPVIVLTGARQTGKTSLLKKLFPAYRFVSLDLPSIAEQAEKDPKTFLESFPPPLLIDEVQYAPGLFRHLKHWVDENRKPGTFILTGSQKFTLMKSLSESLAGRVEILELETLSSHEINSAHPNLAPEKILFRGGYPELYQDNALDPTRFYRSYVSTYLERDLKQIINVTQLREFERFLRVLALRSGQLLNQSEVAKDVGVSPTSIATWLSALIASNQVFLLEPWFSNRTKSMVKTPKVYLHDSGMMNFLIGVESPEEMLRSPVLGAVWETFIFSEIRKLQTQKKGFWHLNFWSDRLKEVDFVMDRGGNLQLIECKWSEHPGAADSQNLDYVERKLKSKKIEKKQIICRAANRYPLTPDIEVVPFRELNSLL